MCIRDSNKDQPELRDAFFAALTEVIADGTYATLIDKWKLGLSAYPDITINEGPQP